MKGLEEKMSDILKLVRPELMQLKPYVSAKMLAGGVSAPIMLDANESPWPPMGPISALCETHHYNDTRPVELYKRVAEINGIPDNQLFMTRGSTEAIDLLIRLFCSAGKDEIMICPPTFSMYGVYACTQNAKVLSVPLLENGQLDLPAIERTCTDATKLIFIPTPNAPMGHMMNREDLLELCRIRAGRSIIVADEAYIEFSNTPEGMLADLPANENLVILRTLSKAYALAGERLGMAIAGAPIIDMLLRIQSPFSISQSSTKAALDALAPAGLVLALQRHKLLKAERERLLTHLPRSSMVEKIFPTEGNFMLIQAKDLDAFVAALAKYGIRGRTGVCAIPRTIRLSLGTPEQNDIMLRAAGIEPPKRERDDRIAQTSRQTKETKIDVAINLDAPSFGEINTGIGFFDHMLKQIAVHAGMGIALTCKGDLEIDQHHSIEDCALALGEAIKNALGDKMGIGRYGFTAPLDEALAEVVLDLSGRPHVTFEGAFPAVRVGEMEAEMVPHFFRSFAASLGATIHVKVTGENTHHMVEAAFKALGRALRQAIARDGAALPSSKGSL